MYNRRNEHDMAILGSKYGLVKTEQIIESYEETLTELRAKELVPQVGHRLQKYDCVLYYRGGAGKEYSNLIRKACEEYGKVLKLAGYGNLGDIERIPCIIQESYEGKV